MYCRHCRTIICKLDQVLNFGQLLYPPPLIDHDRFGVWDDLPCQIIFGLDCCVSLERQKPPIWLHFQLHHFVVVPPSSPEHVEHGCTITNCQLVSKVFLCLNGWIVILRLQTVPFKSVMDKQKKLVLFAPDGMWSPSHTRVGMLIEEVHAIFAPQKLLQVQCIILLLRVAENLVKRKCTPDVKPP